MVDLETWGLTPGSDIRSIGAVVFDPIEGTLGEEFYTVASDGDAVGLTRDASTVAWWAEQSAAAKAALEGYYPLGMALVDFSTFWDRHPGATFWAHGPHFDEAILGACYRAYDFDTPWNHRAPRDCRTIWEAAGGVDLPFEGDQHNALDDAKHQARCVIEAYRRLGLSVS